MNQYFPNISIGQMERTKIVHKYLFIAVKPEYANKLISGQKDIELRK